MSNATITRITHSCHLIEIGGKVLLTDPWFSEKTGFHPGEPIAVSVAELPHLDGVLITHHHYDHCDLVAFSAYHDMKVPMFVAGPVAARARKAGFEDVRSLKPWEHVELGNVTITAAPGKHAVYEITFVVQGGGRTIYFAGDTLLIPELFELPQRFGHFDAVLLPTNGLQIRPMMNRQVVMSANQAAELTSVLKPDLAIPHHYAFTSGWLGDHLLMKGDSNPQHFADAASRLAPQTTVRVVQPGISVAL
jgi:L-ascorbate metabolism protein UlaG (beta-lactamase superfamily)